MSSEDTVGQASDQSSCVEKSDYNLEPQFELKKKNGEKLSYQCNLCKPRTQWELRLHLHFDIHLFSELVKYRSLQNNIHKFLRPGLITLLLGCWGRTGHWISPPCIVESRPGLLTKWSFVILTYEAKFVENILSECVCKFDAKFRAMHISARLYIFSCSWKLKIKKKWMLTIINNNDSNVFFL